MDKLSSEIAFEIHNLAPGVVFESIGENFNDFVMHETSTSIFTYEQFIQAKETAVKKLAETAYIAQRKQAYPAITDQLDMLYWDRVNNTNHWQNAIAEIKQKYPKP